jgi:acyl carrier protein
METISEQDALNWVAGVFEAAPGSLTAGTNREDIPAWDSMGVLMLMAAMDEKFGIVLADTDIKNMRNVGDILGVLRTNGKLG